ncbi:uncharacterized protein TNCV_3991601 [Trichonephila clavipes]|uniref:Mutator-like transposase domain-containing protein n=1 Tax=Trichonephila clavipes TaxID=2585209 RepID=A0A8X6SXH1_TRICX|nr:uncharacterized protein TNCV_3991601 [Trichonephila clavipes]
MPNTKRKNKSSKLSIQKRWCTETKTENNMDISEHNSNVAQLSSGESIFKNERVPMQEKSVLEQENVADTYDGLSYIIVNENALCDIFKYTFCGSCNQNLNLDMKIWIFSSIETGETTPEYDVWYSGHKNDCQINHVGTSGAMEMKAAAKIWSRSEACGFRYTTLLSDGDAKTHKFLNSLKIYGPDVEILKEECINHVSKRLGTSLRNLVKDWRAKGITLGGKSYGSLKETTIKKLTHISTNKNPMHMKCPPGKDSWCFYRRALTKGEKPAPHKFNIGTPINPDYLTKIVPIYQRLASDSLLKGCARCLTQNSNESLHSVIWSKCSKETSAKSRRVNIAVSEAVSEYNFGTLKALKEIQKAANLDLGEEAVKIAAPRDYRRKKERNRQSNLAFRIARRKEFESHVIPKPIPTFVVHGLTNM